MLTHYFHGAAIVDDLAGKFTVWRDGQSDDERADIRKRPTDNAAREARIKQLIDHGTVAGTFPTLGLAIAAAKGKVAQQPDPDDVDTELAPETSAG